MQHPYITLVCCHCGEQISVPQYCGDRFCPVCSASRRSRVRFRLSTLIDLARPLPGESIKHLTLTIPNLPDPDAALDVLIKSFRKLRARAWWKRNVSGGAYVVEITGQDGSWHVHIHAVICARYLPFDLLKRIWMECSPGNHVYIQKIPKAAAVGYLTKYLTKESVSNEDRPTVSRALRSRRLFQCFGSWAGVSVSVPVYRYPCPACNNSLWAPLAKFDPACSYSELRDVPTPGPS